MRPKVYKALTTATGTAVESTATPDGSHRVARSELYRALELLDAQSVTYRLAPKNTPDLSCDRRNRMRQLKTTQGTYNGPIHRADGKKCTTVQELNLAMLDTRGFWEEHPPETQQSWHPILAEYHAGNNLFPPFPDLTIPKIQSHLLHTKESTPGLDGIPYAAWRRNPEASGHAIYQLFLNIITAQEEPPSQVHRRLLSTTRHALSALVVAHCSKHLHQSQSMLNHFREPQKAVLSIQQDLDDTGPRAALFIDMAKAFEKVNPHWAVDVMLARGCNTWLVHYAMYLFTGRRVLHKVQGTVPRYPALLAVQASLPDLCAYSASFVALDALEELTAYLLSWAASAMPLKRLTAKQLKRAASDDGAHRAAELLLDRGLQADTARTALLDGLCSSPARRARHANGAHLVSRVFLRLLATMPLRLLVILLGRLLPLLQSPLSLACHCKHLEDRPLASQLLPASCTAENWISCHARSADSCDLREFHLIFHPAITNLCHFHPRRRPPENSVPATLALRLALSCYLKGSSSSHISSQMARHHQLQHKG